MMLMFALALAAQVAGNIPAPETTPADAGDKDKKVCLSEEITGSIMRKHVCHTKSEWAELRAAQTGSAAAFMDRRRSSGKAAVPD